MGQNGPDPEVEESTPEEPHEIGLEEDCSRPTRERRVDVGRLRQSATSREVRESLARLQTNADTMQQRVRSIDQWISRIEPRLEDTTSPETPASSPEAIAARTAESIARAVNADSDVVRAPAESADASAERRRRSQGVPVERRRAAHAVVADDVHPKSVWTPGRVAALARRRWVPIAAVLLLTFMLALILMPGSRARQVGSAPAAGTGGTQAQKSDNAARGVSQTNGSTDRTTSFNASDAGAAGSTPGKPSAAGPVMTGSRERAGVAGQPDAVAHAWESSANYGTTSDADALPPGDAKARDTAASMSTSASPNSPSLRTGVAGGYRRVNVSSGVMAGNLLYSPQPEYPKGILSLFHPQGEVVMQAIISRRGRVENLRVISGHYMLRGAAKTAVRTWRYRPYLINGTPVQVATIVSVEFHR